MEGVSFKGKYTSANLNVIKFIASLMVIISHSFSLTQGNAANELIYRLSNGKTSLGGVAVAIFFLSSGFFITHSMVNAKSFIKFFSKRVVRIIPPLMAVSFICVIIGTKITVLPLEQYVLNKQTWKYLLNGVLLLNKELPGVFLNSPYMPVVNGALWTLPLEFKCYVIIYICYELKLINVKNWKYGFSGMSLACILTLPQAHIFPCILFLIGATFYVYREKIKYYAVVSGLMVILLIVFVTTGNAKWGLVLCLPYVFFHVCFMKIQVPQILGKLGKISYTIYLWGYPVQQVISCFGIGVTPFENSMISIPITIILGVITYEGVEKPIYHFFEQRYRNRITEENKILSEGF